MQDKFDLSRFTTEAPSGLDAQKLYLCKWCSSRFQNKEDAVAHVSDVAGVNGHPDTANAEKALLRVPAPRQTAQSARGFQNLAARFTDKGEKESTPEPEPDYGHHEGTVDVADLYELLDEFRMKQTENSGWYGASQRLQAFIEEHEQDAQD